ncbi:MAG: helix-turn-helix transcriptional regulator [Desulfovibrio sp.]|nr:helix-turn-helix transcriptional regulator [Desulfovibrio sp.]
MLTTRHVSGLGLACVYMAHGLCFHDGRDAWELDLPTLWLLVGAAAGTLSSALALPLFRGLHGLSGRALRALPGLCAAYLLCLGLNWSSPWLACLGCFCVALPLTFFLDQAVVSRQNLGLFLGLILGAATLFWQLPTIFPILGSQKLVGICLGGMGILSALCATALPADTDASSTHPNEAHTPDRSKALVTLIYMTGMALVFFLLCAVMDWQFYRMQASDFHIPAYCYLYLWAVFPLAGFWMERRGMDSKILLCCLAVVITFPLLIIPLDGTVFYWLIFAVGLFARGTALLFLLLVFAQFRKGFGRHLPHGLILCIPWFCLLASFLIAFVYLNSCASIIPYFFILLVLTASFGYISMHIQYAMTLTGCLPVAFQQPSQTHTPPSPETAGAVPASGISPDAQVAQDGQEGHNQTTQNAQDVQIAFAEFSKKYGLSPREQDVLALMVQDPNTEKALTVLHISKNTFKTHMRQILRKTQCEHRYDLAMLFYREQGHAWSARDVTEATQLEEHS